MHAYVRERHVALQHLKMALELGMKGLGRTASAHAHAPMRKQGGAVARAVHNDVVNHVCPCRLPEVPGAAQDSLTTSEVASSTRNASNGLPSIWRSNMETAKRPMSASG